MELITAPPEAAAWSAAQRRKSRTVAFVPTMGALHEGHIALVKAARKAGNVVASSIFVNPLQFNDPNDLAHYPRQLDQDRRMLKEAGCDLLFAPEKEGIFADFTPRNYDLAPLDQVLEGTSRPGHFQGVVNVVERLLFYVRPNVALFGEKDRQQLAILKHAARNEHWPVQVQGHATVRAADGLALSSRNQRLNPAERAIAPVLYRSLLATNALAFHASLAKAQQAGLAVLATEPAVVLDYLAIAHAETLQPLTTWDGLTEAVALIAAQVGPVRLIDNITLRR